MKEIPLDFIIDTIRYSKQLDGCYHTFVVGSPANYHSSLECISIDEAEKRYNKNKYKQPIMFCTNNVNVGIGGIQKEIVASKYLEELHRHFNITKT